jgi:hypothetical protein
MDRFALSSTYAVLRRHFESLGTRFKVGPLENIRRRRPQDLPYAIDVKEDTRGKYFDLAVADDRTSFQLLQAKPQERHLLLLSNDGRRFLCGHDERHWFVAGVASRVSTVRAAKQALIPAEIWERVKQLPPDQVLNRNNAAFKRQGEWFFVPVTEPMKPSIIFRDEPLQRDGRSKPHICQQLCREGGELVYLVDGRVLTQAEYKRRRPNDPGYASRSVQTRMRNPRVYARGYIRHPDHATVVLHEWHRVFMNAEFSSGVIAFLD